SDRVGHGPGEPRILKSGMLQAAGSGILHGGWGSADSNRLRPHRQARPLVGDTAAHLPGARLLRDLYHLGGLPRRPLRVRQLPLALLLAGAVRRCSSRLVRTEARLVAHVAALHARNPDSLGARWVPAHLLLLPGRILQGVLGRPARMRGGRAALGLPRRGVAAARAAERASLLPLGRARLLADPCPCRLESDVVRRTLRNRSGTGSAGRQL